MQSKTKTLQYTLLPTFHYMTPEPLLDLLWCLL